MNAPITLARRADPLPRHTLPENKPAIVPFYNLSCVSEFAEAMIGKAMLAEAKGLSRSRISIGACAKRANGTTRSQIAQQEIQNAMRLIGHPCKRGEIEENISAKRMSDSTMKRMVEDGIAVVKKAGDRGHNIYALTEWDE